MNDHHLAVDVTARAGSAVPESLVDRVRDRLAASGDQPTPSRVAAALSAEGEVLGDTAVLDVVIALRSELAGAGPRGAAQ